MGSDNTKGVGDGAAAPDAGAAGRHRRNGKGFGFGLLVALGTVLVLGGIVGLVYAGAATLTSMILFGWLLLIGGVVGLAQAIQVRKENAFWLVVAVSALNIAAGVILLRRPEVGATTLTLFVALLLLGAGMFRIVGGIASMSVRMIWTVMVGVIDLVLGLLVLAEWPSNSLYTIGTFISLALLFDGLSLVSLGLTGRRIVGMVRDAEVPPNPPSGHDSTEWRAGEGPTRGDSYRGPDGMDRRRDQDT